MVINNQFQYIHAIRDNRTLTSNAKIVALIIASHFNWMDDNPAFPSLETLAEECSISRASVARGKNELLAHGWLEQTRRYNNSNLYTPCIPTSHTETIKNSKSHTDTRVVSQGDVQTSHSDTLKDNRKDNLIDNNNQEESEEILLGNNTIDISKYISKDYKLSDIKEEVEDKDTFFLIVKERKLAGII